MSSTNQHPRSRGLSRRDWLRRGGQALAAGAAYASLPAFALPPLEDGETLVPFLDPQPIKEGRAMLRWSGLESWITPEKDFFTVQHYGVPEVDAASWELEIGGMVGKPGVFGIEQIKARAKTSAVATLECAGNGVSPGFMGAIGNLRWGGALLSPLLDELDLSSRATEVVFYGADQGIETIRKKEYPQNFARSLSLDQVRRFGVMLVYEMSGQPLPLSHGGPLRAGVPGHFGIAWVKWLNRIEIIDQRHSGRFMARDYVTIRGEKRDGKITWTEKGVSRMNLKSIVARVVRRPSGDLRITGAAWNDGVIPLRSVELKIDDAPWRAVVLGEGLDEPRAWTFWTYDWKNPPAGEHTLVSRARDARGKVQPSAEDDEIKLKRTYWEANQQTPRRITI